MGSFATSQFQGHQFNSDLNILCFSCSPSVCVGSSGCSGFLSLPKNMMVVGGNKCVTCPVKDYPDCIPTPACMVVLLFGRFRCQGLAI